jgi:hypothetical protein
MLKYSGAGQPARFKAQANNEYYRPTQASVFTVSLEKSFTSDLAPELKTGFLENACS